MSSGPVTATVAPELAGHAVHLALFGAGLVVLAVLLVRARPRRAGARPDRGEQARVRALREAARTGTLGSVAIAPQERSGHGDRRLDA